MTQKSRCQTIRFGARFVHGFHRLLASGGPPGASIKLWKTILKNVSARFSLSFSLGRPPGASSKSGVRSHSHQWKQKKHVGKIHKKMCSEPFSTMKTKKNTKKQRLPADLRQWKSRISGHSRFARFWPILPDLRVTRDLVRSHTSRAHPKDDGS